MIDELDARLIELLTERAAGRDAGGVAAAAAWPAGTVQARLDRLQARGVITGYGPDISPAALDHGVMAFVTLEIRQVGGHDSVARQARGHRRGAGGAHHHRRRATCSAGWWPGPTPTCSG